MGGQYPHQVGEQEGAFGHVAAGRDDEIGRGGAERRLVAFEPGLQRCDTLGPVLPCDVQSSEQAATHFELIGERWRSLRCVIGSTEDVLSAGDERVGVHFFCFERHRAEGCLEVRRQCTHGLGWGLRSRREGDSLD